MSVFSRRLRRWDLLQVAAAVLGIVWLAVLAAYAFAAVTVTPSLGSVIAAGAVVPIAGAGILYAWREPGRQPERA